MLMRELPKEAPRSKGWRLASFFCCAGGIDLGFRSAGVESAFANDIDQDAVAAFAKNIGHAPLHRDIRGVGPEDWGSVPFDVVTGGFPCVTFSMAGKRMGVTDDLHGKLYLELCRVIGTIRPRYFVAENVRGILSANGGAAVKLVQAAFLRLGYRTSYELVNMAEHGVPQTRERVIFVGVRLDQWRGSFIFPKKTRRLHDDKTAPKWLSLARSLREAIGDLPSPGERMKMQTHQGGATYAALGKPPTVGYGYSRPRDPSEPSHSQTTSPNVQHVGADHERNKYDESRSGAMSNRVAHGGRRAPTVLSGGFVPGNNSPFIVSSEAPELHLRAVNHESNDAPVVPTYAVSQRVAHRGRPAPTMVSGSKDGNAHPLILDDSHAPNDKPVSDTYAMSKRVAHGRRPSPTVVSENNGNAHPLIDGMRRMTVRECARVQSFPDWFEYPGSQSVGYKLVGNAVPPLYAKRLAEALLEYDERPIVGGK
jgi:DNA (cytosine-5)-methyltransferase 1